MLLSLSLGIAAAPADAAPAEPTSPLTLRSPELTVTVADDFPRVLGYTDNASGQSVTGSLRPVTEVLIDASRCDPNSTAPQRFRPTAPARPTGSASRTCPESGWTRAFRAATATRPSASTRCTNPARPRCTPSKSQGMTWSRDEAAIRAPRWPRPGWTCRSTAAATRSTPSPTKPRPNRHPPDPISPSCQPARSPPRWKPTRSRTNRPAPPRTTTRTSGSRPANPASKPMWVSGVDSGPTAPTAQLDAEAGIAYLLQPESAAPPDVQYGEGTPVADPGFDYGDLRAWQATGATVETNERGQREAVVAVGGEQTITQQLTGLSPGRYVASVDVEVEPRKTRQASLTVTPAGGTAATNSIDRSTLRNTTASDEKHGTYFQPMRTVFEAGSGEAQLALRAAPGSGVVKFDNVRVAKLRDDVPIQPGQWDFENTDAGWGPFFRGDLPDSDANTHRSELHAPYTQRGWNGKAIDDVIGGRYSLKSFEYTPGISYRTTPASVRFQPGHRYRVSFDYENQLSGAYGWTLGADGPGGTKEISTTPFSAQTTSARHVQEFTADNCGDYWVGLKRLGPYEDQVEFALDGFTVEDLGPAADTARSRCG